MNEKINFFEERGQSLEQQIETLKSRYNDYSIYRVIIFIGFTACAIWFLNLKLLIPVILSVIVFIIVFGLVVKKHNRIKKLRNLRQKLYEINKEEVNRLKYNFDGIDEGQEFLNEDHSYTHDLDIFGRNSLFQFLNRAGTVQGRYLLAGWLKNPSSRQEIEQRQASVKELATMIEWRQQVQAHGRSNSNNKEHEKAFFKWLSGHDMISKNRFNLILPYLVILFSSVLIIGYFFEIFPLTAFLLPFVVSVYFLYRIVDYSKQTYEMTQTGVRHLESIRNIILLIERATFDNEHLSENQQVLKQKVIASEKINRLSEIFDWLSLRGNQMYWILNSIFLLDYILLAVAEKWRANYKNEVSNWFDAIAEFEALNSLAAVSYANEDYIFPTITDREFIFEGKNIGHPLIPDVSRVANDFAIEEQGATCIITGSNMAGKSTFLRTLGINAVLAFAGAPVCADDFVISHFHIFSSMRTKDNLEENISSFYAELLRLKMLLEHINVDKPVFYLLDEILKGTNSVDRHIGAESLILQLNGMNTFGLVSTHDLELGNLAKFNQKISNFNFSSSIIDEEIVFDYKLRAGICQSTNASQLMAKIGIQIKSKQ